MVTPTIAGAVAPPHWAADLADLTLERERTTRDDQAAAVAHAAQLAALLQSEGLVWADRLAAELDSAAAAVNARVGHPLLAMRRALTGSVSLVATSGAYVMFVFGFVRPEERTADVEVIVQPDASAGWRLTAPYVVDAADAGALVIRIEGADLGPEAFAQFACKPWLQTLPLKGR